MKAVATKKTPSEKHNEMKSFVHVTEGMGARVGKIGLVVSRPTAVEPFLDVEMAAGKMAVV